MGSTEQIPPLAGASKRDPREGPVFWKEVYWFVVLCLGGATLALWMLPPRLARNRSAVEIEMDLRDTVAELARRERESEAAIAAVENDPFYLEEVVRAILKVKKKDEVFLKEAGAVSDN